MSAFDFLGTNGTLLGVYDTRFNGAGATALRLQDGTLQGTATYGGGRFWFENGQGNDQQSEALLSILGTVGGEVARVSVQTNTLQVGYEVELRGDGDLDVTRNGSYITRMTGDGATTQIAVRLSLSGGVLTVRSGGVIRGTYTDSTPLTGGFPGAVVVPATNLAAPSIFDWSDLEPVIAAVLSVPGFNTVGATTVTGTVTSDRAGTVYCVATPTNVAPTIAQIKAGIGGGIVAAKSQVMVVGVNSLAVTGLTAVTEYYLWFVGSNGADSNVVGSATFTTTPTAPIVTSLDLTSVRPGDTVTAFGTTFNATQSGGTLTMNGVVCPIISWAAGAIAFTATQGTSKLLAPLNVVVTNGVSGLASTAFSGVTLQPDVGWAAVDLGTLLVAGKRIKSLPVDAAPGDQAHYNTVGGLVEVFSNGGYSRDPSVTSFGVKLWSPVIGTGATGFITG